MQREQQQRGPRRRGSCRGRSRSRKLPAKLPSSAGSGLPPTMLANATPHSSAGVTLESQASHASQRGPPDRIVVLVAVLSAMTRTISATRISSEREIEAAEHRRVPLREGREGRPARDQQPHLVAVPHRADRADRLPALGLRAPDPRAAALPTPKSKPSRIQVAGPQDGDQHEPERLGDPWGSVPREERQVGRRRPGPDTRLRRRIGAASRHAREQPRLDNRQPRRTAASARSAKTAPCLLDDRRHPRGGLSAAPGPTHGCRPASVNGPARRCWRISGANRPRIASRVNHLPRSRPLAHQPESPPRPGQP